MKIESSKTNRTEKRIAPNDHSQTSFQTVFKTAEKNDVPPAKFAEVLEEARSRNAKSSSSVEKTDSAGRDPENAEANRDDDCGKTIQNREKVEAENDRSSRSGDDEESGEREKNSDAAALPPGFLTAANIISETTIPAARSILHVADLERVVSTIRSQNIKNAEQIVIALKHSVLEGLQIKLTIDKNGTLQAEFLAFNEQIKSHLHARKQEIIQIFRERGVKLSELNVRQGSEFARPNNDFEAASAAGKTFGDENVERAVQTEEADSQTSYRI